ncbi:MAG TPA: RecQ family ATP-dependent DNA helicase [Acidimicrobiia bacterium]|nr:RecQ family ATP-dependent DNA helicase [Acidimicrobiia bacterium]
MTADTTSLGARAAELLGRLAGPDARLRPDQRAAIEAVAGERRRVLVVQRTGFGKSAIYFIATRLRRDAGAGPTLVVSPLLALMRDQVAAAERMGVRSATINSTNPDDWSEIEAALAAGEIDLLTVSPERLNAAGFARRVLPRLARGLGLLVVDEAHCISDWGHDFRPDYRRIRDAIANLAPGTPVLATTATANARVCADVADQLGDDVLVLRGPLERESLHLGVAAMPAFSERLAWVAERIRRLEGTGIVYCLTVAHTDLVAGFLQSQGIDARAYSSDTPPEERERLEAAFKANEVKALVATSALGMGVDKPDVTFVLHLGAPPSPIAYYQQVGRAGRSVPRAEAWLLPGAEDERIWAWFASVGLPPEPLVRRVLDAVSAEPGAPSSLPALEAAVDLRRARLETLLKILDVEGVVERVPGGVVRTGAPWGYDRDRVERVQAARDAEAAAMLGYVTTGRCLMEFLRSALDDPDAAPCGRCVNCGGLDRPAAPDPALAAAAVEHLRRVDVVLEPRRAWPRNLAAPKGNIRPATRAEAGRALCRVGDAGWWPAVERLLAAAAGADAVDEAVWDDVIAGVTGALRRWRWDRRPTWITWVPSSSSPVPERLARAIGEIGRLPVHRAVVRARPGRPQAELANSTYRCTNVWPAFAFDEGGRPGGAVPAGPVLLVDDTYDSGWTLTVVAHRLREAGAEAVFPFVLARR